MCKMAAVYLCALHCLVAQLLSVCKIISFCLPVCLSALQQNVIAKFSNNFLKCELINFRTKSSI